MYNIPKTAFEEAQEENEVEDEEDEKEIEMEVENETEDDRVEYVAADSDDESDLVMFRELSWWKCYSLINNFFRTVKVEIQKKLIWTAVLKQMTLTLR